MLFNHKKQFGEHLKQKYTHTLVLFIIKKKNGDEF